MWRGSGYLLQADRFRAPRHHPLAGTNRPPRYGSRPVRSGWASQEHVGPSFIVDWISRPTPPAAPTLPSISEDCLSPFRAHHDVKSQPELVGGSTWLSDRERLNGSRYLASKHPLAEFP